MSARIWQAGQLAAVAALTFLAVGVLQALSGLNVSAFAWSSTSAAGGSSPRPAAGLSDVSANCPPGWQLFDNFVTHYTVCFPPGWVYDVGFGPQPLAEVEPQTLERVFGMAIVFNHTGDQHQPDEIGGNISLMPPEMSSGECDPAKTPVRLAGGNATYCELRLNIGARKEVDVRPDGPVHLLKVLFPHEFLPRFYASLPQYARPQSVAGYRLSLSFSSSSELWPDQKDEIWRIVDSVRLY